MIHSKLKDLDVFFLDLQTTGSTPLNSYILEMAFGSLQDEIQSFLVEQPEKKAVPNRIQFITGVKDSDMADAVAFPEAMKRLINYVKGHSHKHSPVCIIHFAQFEKPFLTEAFKSIGSELPFDVVCTHEIAKRLLPNLPTRGIKGLAGYFGYDAGELKRSASHVEATKAIWKELIKSLEEKNITDIKELKNWIIETPKATRSKYEYPLPKEKRLTLPNVPGIYRMLNFKGEVLYVGKATSLKSRVNSYFRGQKNRDHKKLEMLAQVYDLHVTTCETPLEAALMETDEIKRLNPRYNISLKVGRRSLVFFDQHFLSMQNTSDDIHVMGPYSNSLVFDAMMALSSFMRNFKAGDLPDQHTFFEEIDPNLIKDGLDIFCLRHNFTYEKLSSMRTIIACGLIWQRRKEIEERLIALNAEEEYLEGPSSDEEIENELEDDIEEINDLLTSEDIADKIERHFMRIGRAYQRARKMNRMLNVDVEYQMPKKKLRKLKVRNGHIVDLNARITSPESSSWVNHSIETYDRITVLLSELERIKTNHGDYRISFQ